MSTPRQTPPDPRRHTRAGGGAGAGGSTARSLAAENRRLTRLVRLLEARVRALQADASLLSTAAAVAHSPDDDLREEELREQNQQLIESQRLLEESRDRFVDIYDFAPVAFVTLCGQGIVREVNLTAATLLAATRGRLLDKPFVLCVADTHRKAFHAHLRRCLAEGFPVRTELIVRGAGGRAIPVSLETTASESVDTPEGRQLRLRSVLLDLTERRAAEAERERMRETVESERLLRTVLRALPVGVQVMDPNRRVLVSNDACERIFAVAVPTGTGTPHAYRATWTDSGKRLLSNDWPVLAALDRGEPVGGASVNVEMIDGSRRSLLCSGVPIHDADGSVIGAVGVYEDVTGVRRAELALRDSESTLRLAMEAGHLGHWDWDRVHDVVRWSLESARMLGLDPARLVGPYAAFVASVHPEDRDRVSVAVRLAIEQRRDYVAEYRVVRANGEVCWIASHGRPHYDAGGRAVRMVGVISDITDRRKAEDALRHAKGEAEEANRLKDDFLAVVSHELRTPLSAILLYTHLLRRGLVKPEDQPAALETIETSGKAQAQLIEDLLELSAYRVGKMRLALREADVVTVVRAAVEAARPAAAQKGIVLTGNYPNDENDPDHPRPRVMLDPDRLRQVLDNLLANAVKFTPKGGRVSVRVAYDQRRARIEVVDSGDGISSEFLPHVFDRFRQADASMTRKKGGLGLGLAIAEQLVELHGGTIKADSAGVGRGSTFSVELPLVAPPADARLADAPSGDDAAQPQRADRRRGAAETSRTAKANGEPQPLAGVRVLLVEDEPATREATQQVLSASGATVTAVSSAAAARRALSKAVPDVFIFDLGLPDEDGFALLDGVRHGASPAARAVPAAALSAYARPEDRDRAVAAGFQVHLPKPAEPARLVEAVARLAASASAAASAASTASPPPTVATSAARRAGAELEPASSRSPTRTRRPRNSRSA